MVSRVTASRIRIAFMRGKKGEKRLWRAIAEGADWRVRVMVSSGGGDELEKLQMEGREAWARIRGVMMVGDDGEDDGDGDGDGDNNDDDDNNNDRNNKNDNNEKSDMLPVKTYMYVQYLMLKTMF